MFNWNGEFAGKVVLITGAASGLGRQAAIQFGADGAKVVIGDIQIEKGQGVVKEIKAAGGEATFVECNVGSEEAVKNLIDTAIKTYGTIDILVNNAGGGGGLGMPFTRPSVEDWNQAYENMIRGTYLCTKYVYDLFKERGTGKIVNTASVAGKESDPPLVAYSAMKAAIINMTQTLAKELGPYGINVNAVCPGLIYTPIWQRLGKILSMAFPNRFPNMEGRQVFEWHMHNMQMMPDYEVTEEDIANGIMFLASSLATGIQGQSINICAGMTTK